MVGESALRRAEEAALRHCVGRGLLSEARVEVLRAEASESGASVLALVARAVPRDALEALRRVHRDALSAAPSAPPLLRGQAAEDGDAPWQDAETFVVRGSSGERLLTERLLADPTDTIPDLTTLPLPRDADPATAPTELVAAGGRADDGRPTVRDVATLPLPGQDMDGQETVRELRAVGSCDTTLRLEESAPLPLPAPPPRVGSPASLAPTRADPRSAETFGPAQTDPLPVLIGPFPVQAELGRGRTGVVYRAWHGELGRDVAIKVPPPGAGADAAERFLAAARAMARLRHPNVVMIHEVGEAGGTPYLVIDLLGRTLADHLAAEAPLAPRQAAQLVRAMALGVAEAHERAVLHGALRPANVLLTPRLEPVVTDFGMTAPFSARDAAYAAPEALRGGPVDHRADVYSLGAILYEAITGEPPFAGADLAEVRLAVERDEPVAPTYLVEGIDPGLEAVCLRCLEKAPGDRPATAQELGDELGRWLDGLPVRRLPLSRRLARAAARNPALALVAVLAITIIAALAVVLTLLLARS